MILKELKEQTKRQHERLESRLDLFKRVTNVEQYRKLLERFYGFYSPLEPAAARTIQATDQHFNYLLRLKTPHLHQDLTALGMSDAQIRTLPICADLPNVDRTGKFYGYLYVAEGSTLGGQFISKHFAQTLRLDENSGGAFFRAYGNETGKMWREFQTAVTDFSEQTPDRHEIVAAAAETFVKMEKWLTAE